jgi:hypothetical protein
MMLRYAFLSFVLLCLFGNAGILHAQTTSHAASYGLGNSSVVFIPNRGQVADVDGRLRPDVLFTADARNAHVFVRAGAISYVFDRLELTEASLDYQGPRHEHGEEGPEEAPVRLVEQYRMDLELIGAREHVETVVADQAPGVRNYYLAQCPDGVRNVPAFQHVTLKEVYPHIDMVLRGTEDGMKVDFVVRPGGRPSDIRLRYAGASDVTLNDDGSVTARTPLGELVESAPVSMQMVGSAQHDVVTRFRLDGDVLTFDVEHYDAARTLTIDPVRRWSTYYGGTNSELLLGGDPTEVDRGGNAIVTGYVNGNNFPTTTGAHQTTYGGSEDAFVVKINGNGVLQWATYYGGSQQDLAHGVVSDTNLNVIIAGHTFSNNFPVTSGAHRTTFGGVRDAFIVKFDKDGVRQWATYYGGSAFDDGYGFAADSTGAVALLVTTQNAGLQTTNMVPRPTNTVTIEPYDVLIAKFSSAGVQQWATYFGGQGTDYGYAVGTDTAQSIILSGWTYSNNLPMTNAAQSTLGGSADAFVAKYNKDGTRLWSTYYGGPNMENDDNSGLGFVGVATDFAGDVFVGGVVSQGGFPTTAGAAQATYGGGAKDGYVLKLAPNGALQWATYFGGSGDDAGTGVAAKVDGSVLLTGWTASTNLPTTANCIACGSAGMRDVFIARMNASGARDFVDYYGGSNNDEGHGISFDPYGSMVVAGNTWSTNFPISNAAQAFKGGNSTTNSDAFIVLFCDPSKPRVDSSGPLRFCPGDSVVLTGFDGYAEYRWNDLNQSTSRRIVVKETMNLVLWAKGLNGCGEYSDTIKVRVFNKIKPRILPAGPVKICTPDSVILDAGAGYASYTWMPGGESSRTLKVTASGTFRVMTIDPNGCADTSDPVVVTASPKPVTPTISPAGPITICEGDPLVLTAAGSPSDTYRWSNNATGQSMTPSATGRYRVTVTTAQGCTATSQDVDVTIYPKPQPVIYPQGPTTICEGDSVLLTSSNGYSSYRWSSGQTTTNITVKTGGTYTLTVTDDKGCVGKADIQITVLPRPTPKVTILGPATFCEGDSVTLDAGDGYGSYRWSNGEQTRTIFAKDSGSYWVMVTANGANCPGYSDTITVNVRKAPRAELTGPTTVCQNTSATYSVPAAPGRAYTWTVNGSGASITSGDGTESIVVKWGTNGTGSVTLHIVDQATGCSSDTTLSVVVGNSLVPSISASRPTRLCPGDSVTLDAGAGYSEYHWSNGSTARSITVRDSGSYSVTVRNAAGCGGTSNIIRVSLAPAPTPTIVAARTPALCPGDTLTLTTGSYAKYQWSNGQRTRSIVVSQPGKYTVAVTDASGCQGAAEITVVQSPVPEPTIDGPNSVCTNARGQYCADGDPSDQYTWTVTGGTIVSGQGTRCIDVQWGAGGSGRVELEMRAASTSCRGYATPLVVTVATTLQPTITAEGSTEVCSGDSVTISAPAGYGSYAWSTGSTERSIRVGAGEYTVMVTAGSCSGSGSIVITERPPVVPQVSVRGPLEFCEGDSTILEAPNGFATYRWSTGDSLPFIIVKASGRYSVAVTDAFGCKGASDEVIVRVNPLPAKPTITRVGDELESSPAVAYQWFLDGQIITGANAQRYRPTATGQHTVRVRNEFGCEAFSDPAEGAYASAVVNAPTMTAIPGQHVSLPITVKTSTNLDAVFANEFSATLRFNRSLLFPTGATPEGRVEGSDRVIAFTGVRPAGMAQGTIATLEFIAALGDTTATPLILDSLVWLDASVQTSLEAGLLKIESQGGWRLYIPGGRLYINPPSPNPAIGRAVITFETIEPGLTDVALFDVLGRRVLQLENREMPPGVYSVDVNPEPLAGGTYFIVLVTPTGRVVQPMQVAH